MKDSSEKYQFYIYCKVCGKIINEDISDDNNGICDDCYIDKRTWSEIEFGEYYEE